MEKLEPLFTKDFSIDFGTYNDILSVLVNSYEIKEDKLNIKFSLMYNRENNEFVPLKYIKSFSKNDITILNFFNTGDVYNKIKFKGCIVKQVRMFNKGNYESDKNLHEVDVDFVWDYYETETI